MNTLNTGSTLKNSTYKIVRTLGQGSFGITYLASARTTIAGALGKMDVEVNVAIKEFFMSDLNSRSADGTSVEKTDSSLVKNYRTKFRREAENLSKLHNSNIVKVLDVFDENNTTYYVMEYVDGMNLDDYIKQQGRLTVSESLRITKEVCSALSYMHEHKMLHLDLKPKNIMRDRDGHIRLIDFGLSKQYNDSGEPESSTTIGLGTPGYAPTEQANYKQDGTFPVTLDIYALGVTLFKMLTGKTPPEASMLVEEGFPLDVLKQAGVSEDVIAIVEKAMAPFRKQRYQTVASLSQAIAAVSSAEHTDYEQTSFEEEKEEEIVGEPEVEIKTVIKQQVQTPVPQFKPSIGEYLKNGIVALFVLLVIFVAYKWISILQESETSSPSELIIPVEGNGKTVAFKMIKVAAGSFQMGSTSGYDEDSVYLVTISKDYYIGETEVTQDLWEAVMGNNPSYFKGGNNPVEQVSYEDCLEFIQKLNDKTGKNFRMPTEVEWEYAARGGNKSRGYMYAGSNTIGDVAWYYGNSGSQSLDDSKWDYDNLFFYNCKTRPVAQKLPNEYGLYDMSGNVREWCDDKYDESYYFSSDFDFNSLNSRALDSIDQTDLIDSSSGSVRVYRGGGWNTAAVDCSLTIRDESSPTYNYFNLGLRLAL